MNLNAISRILILVVFGGPELSQTVRAADGGCSPQELSIKLPEGVALYASDSLRPGAENVGIAGRTYCVKRPRERGRNDSALAPAQVIDPANPAAILTVSPEHLEDLVASPFEEARRPAGGGGYPSPFEAPVLNQDQCCTPNLPPLARILDASQSRASAQNPTTELPEATIPKQEDERKPASDGESTSPNPRNPTVIPTRPITAVGYRILEALGVISGKKDLPVDRPSEGTPSGSASASPSGSETAGAPQTNPAPRSDEVASQIGPMVGPLVAQSALERSQDYYESLRESLESLRKSAESDEKELSSRYQDLTLQEVATRLETAEKQLESQSKAIEEGKSVLPEGERIRFSQTYKNAAEKARLARELTQDLERRKQQEEERARLAGGQPDMGFLLTPKKGENPLARSDELIDLLGKKPAPTSPDGLTQRLVLLNGLPSKEKETTQKRLKLSEPLKLALQNGRSLEIELLHNGYRLGGDPSSLACSSFVSAALPTDIRKGTFTTWDFRTMWTYLRTGVPPKDPKYQTRRLEKVLDTATAFEALDLYRGEEPGIGDLLVHRLPWEPTGHVFVVREYHRETQIVSVIEAVQSAGTVREREFPLSLDTRPLDARQTLKARAIRPGLMVLRLRPVRQKVCSLRPQTDLGRGPASLPQQDTPTPPKSDDPPPAKGGGW